VFLNSPYTCSKVKCTSLEFNNSSLYTAIKEADPADNAVYAISKAAYKQQQLM